MRKLEWDDMGVKHQPSGMNAYRIRQDMWMHQTPAEDDKDDNHAKQVGLGCPSHGQRNDHIRMYQIHLSRSEKVHEERPNLRAGQEVTSAWEAYESIEDVVKKTWNT
ncbi:hypothetical protein RB195_000318 [Necator americanus]|uniref:SCP domain-containing protein n=1 Tax=Necator americanus TaxID=51031 RepID=A0ABR1DAR4_NECAM